MAGIIINAGSENKGGTLEQARKNAQAWLTSINKKDGFPDVVMTEGTHGDNFEFLFTHKVTGKTVSLIIHGYTKKQVDKFLFAPRIYWNGSSTAEPCIEDWLTDEYAFKITYYKK